MGAILQIVSRLAWMSKNGRYSDGYPDVVRTYLLPEELEFEVVRTIPKRNRAEGAIAVSLMTKFLHRLDGSLAIFHRPLSPDQATAHYRKLYQKQPAPNSLVVHS